MSCPSNIPAETGERDPAAELRAQAAVLEAIVTDRTGWTPTR